MALCTFSTGKCCGACMAAGLPKGYRYMHDRDQRSNKEAPPARSGAPKAPMKNIGDSHNNDEQLSSSNTNQ